MSTDRCDYSDLPKTSCDHCRHGSIPPRSAVATALPGHITARYRGQCAGCGEPYAVGALIEYDPVTGGWLAECCATDGEVDW